MDRLIDFLFTFFKQIGGGPGPVENNLVRFGLAALFWGVLLWVAWSRQRHQQLPRERLLVWGFGLGFVREAYMFVHVADQVISGRGHNATCSVTEPLEHALVLAAVVMVGGSFLRYILDDPRLARQYILAGLFAAVITSVVIFVWWAGHLTANPQVRFHDTWAAWLFHAVSSIFLGTAMAILVRKRGWLSYVVLVALSFLFLGEFSVVVNLATGREFSNYICPIGNSFHIWAIPVFGYVYFREQAIEKRQAEDALRAYRDQLEDLVDLRTAELSQTNAQLQQEIGERIQTQTALAYLSRQNELILNSAGEGIFGVDLEGRHTFVNPAAAQMLGFRLEELIGQPSHATWHHSKPDGSPYPEQDCPLHTGYKSGVVCRGDDQFFWRRDAACFPVRYVSTPIYENGELQGAVVVFQDIAERRRAEAEIARRNAEVATLEERQRIAADMHDGLGQTLSYLGLRTDLAAEMLKSGQVEPVLNEFDQLRDIIGAASKDVRRSIASLQDAPRPRRSLQDALRVLIAEFAVKGGPAFMLNTPIEEPLIIPPDQHEQVIRVIREGVVNANRHARAHRITLDLNVVGDMIRIGVKDDGRGFERDQVGNQEGEHFGLSIMRARAARIGGHLEIEARPGRGTQVTLTWPRADDGAESHGNLPVADQQAPAPTVARAGE